MHRDGVGGAEARALVAAAEACELTYAVATSAADTVEAARRFRVPCRHFWARVERDGLAWMRDAESAARLLANVGRGLAAPRNSAALRGGGAPSAAAWGHAVRAAERHAAAMTDDEVRRARVCCSA